MPSVAKWLLALAAAAAPHPAVVTLRGAAATVGEKAAAPFRRPRRRHRNGKHVQNLSGNHSAIGYFYLLMVEIPWFTMVYWWFNGL